MKTSDKSIKRNLIEVLLLIQYFKMKKKNKKKLFNCTH